MPTGHYYLFISPCPSREPCDCLAPLVGPIIYLFISPVPFRRAVRLPAPPCGPIILFIHFSRPLRASRAAAWPLLWAPLFIYLFLPSPSGEPCGCLALLVGPIIYLFITQPSSMIACPVLVSAGSSAGLGNRVGDSPCLQTVRISFRIARNHLPHYSFIYFSASRRLRPVSEGCMIGAIIYLFIYQPAAQSSRAPTRMHDGRDYLFIYQPAAQSVRASTGMHDWRNYLFIYL